MTIFSKANLQVVEMTKPDKAIPSLDNVHFLPDGSSVGANGLCVMAVSPEANEVRSKVPLTETSLNSPVTISSETVREVLRGMPKDTTFAGVLEHCDLSEGNFVLTDGKRTRTVSGKVYPRSYVEYKKVFENAAVANWSGGVRRVVTNLRRLVDVLNTIDRMFSDSSKKSPGLS